ncbi:MAG TPA: class I SAM-dependent methyltransferase [Polyangiales bacterium]|nr:class I SAM-dependent methyltransferase [Polyangiales bacterium]
MNEQAALWNGTAGRAWVDAQELLDGMFAPFEHELVKAVAQQGARQVLDVGCGTGSTTLAIARLAEVHAVGVDVSRPMLELAQKRAVGTRASFVEADAQQHRFAPYDMVVSRFGVMFFADPPRAFANLHRAARPGATLHMLVWRSAADNPFMTTAERAVGPLLPQLPPRVANGPGQFAFADAERVRALLTDSGWSAIDIQPVDAECTFPERELVRYLTRLGPLGQVLAQLDPATRTQAIELARAAFAPYVQGDLVRYTAACWRLHARRGSTQERPVAAST